MKETEKNKKLDIKSINQKYEKLYTQINDESSRQILDELKKAITSYIDHFPDSDLSRENKQVREVEQDFSRTMDALVNLVFKVKRRSALTFEYLMFEGKLAKDLGLTTQMVKGKPLEDVFGEATAAFYNHKYEQSFEGKRISYKHRYKNRYFYTTLSPVFANGEVVEVIGSAIEITSYEEAENKIRHLASHDPLTNLPNRGKLQSDLPTVIDQREEGAILFCNLDRFKYVNDAMGYMAGDQVIQTMAKRIGNVLSDEDLLYRLGSDEFLIWIGKKLSSEQLTKVAHQILQEMSEPIHLMGKQIYITARIGIARYPLDATTSDDLIGKANLAMHFCKINGRHNLLFYIPHMNRHYNQLISLEGDLREAISRNDLQLYFQPKVDVHTGFISGMEALVRWEHPDKGNIPPGEFIPLAEETGLINQLDEWVLKEACRQNQEWISKGYAPERIAVNVSANEIQHADYSEKVRRTLLEVGLEPQFLEIEVTENSVMQNTEQCIKTMQDLKAMGVSLSIDDFGTGYSSLSYLRKFPIHYLKIDQAFIKGVIHDPSDSEIVKAMIQLADAFKLEVVAEGVENADVLSFLKENECAYYQGYHFSKPLPPEEMEKLLTKKQTYL